MIDPWALPAVRQHEEPVDITDPRQPGTVITVRLRELDIPEMSFAMEKADDLSVEYIDGDEATDTHPVAYPFRGEPVRLSRRLFQNLCMLEAMQADEQKGDIDWWMGIAKRMPDGFSAAVAKARAINKRAEKKRGNAFAAAGGHSSDPPSISGNGIPESSSGTREFDTLTTSPAGV